MNGKTHLLCCNTDHTPALDTANCQCIQEVIGILFYYAWAADPTLLTALGTLTTQQFQSTQATTEALAAS